VLDYLLRRLALTVPVLLAVTVFVFIFVHLLPIPRAWSPGRMPRCRTSKTVANARGDGVGNAGVRKLPLVTRHILPGTLPGVIVYASLRMGTSSLTAAALSFIGPGAQPPSPEWGTMLADGRSYLGVTDHIMLFPGLAIFVTVLAFNLLGDGLRDAIDQRLRT
jgi:ABC-type antimicrobial peptide transport system permease subunit